MLLPMGRGKTAYGRIALAAIALGGVSWLACDDGDGTTFNRVSETGGGKDATTDATPSGLDAAGDVAVEAASDAGTDADGEAGSVGPITFATGSGESPSLAVGYGDHTCVVAGAERSVYCWGANDRGQLGVGSSGDGGTTVDLTTATKIATDETGLLFINIDEITAAAWHTCARRGDVLFCWGQRFSGGQAEPSADPAVDRTKPRAIGNLAVKSIAAGGAHTCAVRSGGSVVCWGSNDGGRLGNGLSGTANNSSVPVAVTGLLDVGPAATS